MKRLLVGLLAASTPAYAALVSRVSTFVDGQILTADGINGLNTEFNNVIDGTNSIDNSNIDPAANIDANKIGASIAGPGLVRDSSTGTISVQPDDVGIEISSGMLQIKDEGVTGSKISPTAVDGSSLSISSGSIGIKDGGVQQIKREIRSTGSTVAAGGVAESSSSGIFTNTSDVPTDVTNLSVTITTTGRPVLVTMQSTASGAGNVTIRKDFFELTSITDGRIAFIRDSNTIATHSIGSREYISPGILDSWSPSLATPCPAFLTIDLVGAGTYTYKVQAWAIQTAFLGTPSDDWADAIDVIQCKLVAYEL